MIEKMIELTDELNVAADQQEETRAANENMTRVNIRISKDLHAMYKLESERTGISMSILMYKDLEQVRQQKVMMQMMPEFMKAIQEMQGMAKNKQERNEDAERSAS